MLFLIDENTTASIGILFEEKGFEVEHVRAIKELRGQSDEVIFNYAAKKEADIVTRDLGFTKPGRFDLSRLAGMVVLRFPNEISVKTVNQEVERLIAGMEEKDFYKKIIVVEPGSIRSRELV